MKPMTRNLKLSCSTLALVTASSFATVTGALAQSTVMAPDALPPEQVIVTGSNLRGVAPVGSAVITLDQEAIKTVAPANLQQLLTTVTALSDVGGNPQGEEGPGSFYSPQIHQLAGSASNSTLVVLDGLRLPGGGTQGYVQTDPNMIPTVAIQRVEVLADGASSIYGSDAVAGVVNFITRKSYEGLEIDAQDGFADQYNTYNVSLLAGHKWDTGSVMLAAGYIFQSNLPDSARKFMSAGDDTALGGNNNNAYGCPVAAIAGPSNTFYLGPNGAQVSNAAHTSQNCNTQILANYLPQSVRENALVRYNQDFGDRLTTSFMVDVNDLNTKSGVGPGTVSNVTVYGPLATTKAGCGYTGLAACAAGVAPSINQINPFFQQPTAISTQTSESVTWVDLAGNGGDYPYGYLQTTESTIYGHFTATYKLSDSWNIDLWDSLGYNHGSGKNINTFCASCAYLGLNGTAQSSGSTTTSDISGQNVISLQPPPGLSAANAIDVWNPLGGGNQTTAAANLNMYRGTYGTDDYDMHNQTRLQISGPMFDLPAGPVKAAFGLELENYHLIHDVSSLNGTQSNQLGEQQLVFRYHRVVYSIYGEVNIPVVSPEMDIPGINKLTFDVSGRYDKFSDVGVTANPKYAMNWEIIQGLQVRANYSMSFVAPPEGVLGDPSLGGMYSGSGASVSNGQAGIPSSVYPNVTSLPGVTCVSGLCTIPSADQGLNRQLGGSVPGLKPEQGDAWSVGVDFAPTFLPGFNASATLWNNQFKGGVTTPSITQVVSSPSLQSRFTVCPAGCSPAQIAAFTRVAQGAFFTGTLPATVYFLFNHDESNVLWLNIQGVDANISYNWDMGDWGHFKVADSLTIFTKYDQCGVGGGGCFSILNTSGVNTTFASIQTEHRFNVGWTGDAVSVDAFVNYTAPFRYEGSNAVNPAQNNGPGGTFSGGGDIVHANLTMDLHVAYNFPDGMFSGDQVYLDAKNLFDTDPPFENAADNGVNVGGGFGFDKFVANPLGRILSVGMRAVL